MSPSPTPGEGEAALIGLLAVGQTWRDDVDGECVTIVSLDPGTTYPVQFRWVGGGGGRDTVGGFLDDHSPPGARSEWLTTAIETREAALRVRIETLEAALRDMPCDGQCAAGDAGNWQAHHEGCPRGIGLRATVKT